MIFEASAIPPATFSTAYWFLFRGSELLVDISNSQFSIPKFQDPTGSQVVTDQKNYLGTLNTTHCFCASITDMCAEQRYVLKDLRTLFGNIEDEFYKIAGKALQIINWERTHKFCGQCGTPMRTSTYEYAKICPTCDLTLYPRISPAIIVAIIREGKILLARRFGSQMFSVLAGYVEAGETLEQTVYRETQEEVNIQVKNVRYFSSQPWPFSYSLMLAFTAEYECGEITPDGKEIEEAQWYAPNELPKQIPGPLSVARSLIEWFKRTSFN